MSPQLAIWHAAAQHLPWAAARAHLLDADEQTQLRALGPKGQGRAWFVLGRVLRRVALEACAGTHASAWRFDVTALGKPVATRISSTATAQAGENPAISLAHTEGHVVVAVGACAHVGVDVERLGRLTGAPARIQRLMDHVLTPAEHSGISSLPDVHWPAAVLQRWALKEAVAKALGQGLRGPWRHIAPDVAYAPLHPGEARAQATALQLPADWQTHAPAPIWCGLLRPQGPQAFAIAWAAAAVQAPAVQLQTP